MGVTVSKLWGSRKFKNLSNNARMLYIYLTNNSFISYLGVVCQTPDEISATLNLTVTEIREASKELIDQNDLYVKGSGDDIYFIIPAHFSTVGKADTIIEKIKSELKSLPMDIVEFLDSIGINSSNKKKKFNKPTIEDIEKYSLSQGYFVDGKTFYEFYDNNPLSDENFWYDGRGKIVSDWKAKLRNVWASKAIKITFPKDAPKGFETFYIKSDSGDIIVPDSWKDGLPVSKNFIHHKKLRQEYDKRKGNS